MTDILDQITDALQTVSVRFRDETLDAAYVEIKRLRDKRSEVRSGALADQIHDACPHKIDEPPNCALVKSRLECACEHVHMHAIRAARSGDAAGSGCVAQEAKHCGDDDDRMERISALIARLQSTLDQFGDTCVYIRRGGLSWGAVALNRRSDDQKNGVFDLQAQHDRDMEQRVGQVERLIADRNRWMERAMATEVSPVPSASRGTES